MGFLKNLLSGGASDLVNSVGNVLDKVITTKGDKMELENEIKKAEMQFQLDMAKLTIEEKQLVYSDIASAREMTTKIATSPEAPKLLKLTSTFLAFGTTLLTFGLFYIIIFKPNIIEDKGREVIVYILGVLSAIVTQVFSFYFGSSQSSTDKNKMLNDLYIKSSENKNQ